MSLTSKQIDELRAYAKDRKGELAKLITDAADTIEMLSAKLHASQMERSSQYYHGGWIPCSERLPEEDDYKSCIECLDGAVWYFTENGTMGLGYYYKSTKEWSTTDDLKTDGKVIAWRRLPEPYQEEGD